MVAVTYPALPEWMLNEIKDLESEMTCWLSNLGFPGYTVKFDIKPLLEK